MRRKGNNSALNNSNLMEARHFQTPGFFSQIFTLTLQTRTLFTPVCHLRMSGSPESARLRVTDICKSFPGVRALHNVCLHINENEVLSVVGENGAGKSTLMKILAGVQPQDSGTIHVNGRVQEFRNVSDAMDNGIALIHQELNLADNLEVGANIFLGREPLKCGLVDSAEINRRSTEFLSRVGLNVSPSTLVSDLTIGQQQLVEIAKALSVDAKVLIMDEPTSSLSAGESERLFEVIRDLRSNGVSIIYISHRLAEVQDLSDRVTVLRDGENAGDLVRKDVNHDSLVRLMVGRDISRVFARTPNPPGDVAVEVKDLVTSTWPSHKLSFRVHRGEVVGVAGLVGAGRTEMLRTLFGVDQPLSGDISVGGKAVQLESPQDAIAAGLALVPEDRKQEGVVLEFSIRHNIGLAGLRRNAKPGAFINFAKEQADTDSMIGRLRVKTPDDQQIVQNLSGGNQQKVVLGKWLSMAPQILLLDEPTRGIDVGAKQEIYQLMDELAKQGIAILFVSSELEEIIGLSDRALVMHEGCITGELQRSELTEESIMNLATGVSTPGTA